MEKPPTKVAKRVSSLKKRVLRAVASRERVPKNLFWSLFKGEIEEIRKEKKQAHDKKKAWLAGDEEE